MPQKNCQFDLIPAYAIQVDRKEIVFWPQFADQRKKKGRSLCNRHDYDFSILLD